MNASSHVCTVLGVYCHESKGQAKNAAKKANGGRVYLCKHCRKWHFEGSK